MIMMTNDVSFSISEKEYQNALIPAKRMLYFFMLPLWLILLIITIYDFKSEEADYLFFILVLFGIPVIAYVARLFNIFVYRQFTISETSITPLKVPLRYYSISMIDIQDITSINIQTIMNEFSEPFVDVEILSKSNQLFKFNTDDLNYFNLTEERKKLIIEKLNLLKTINSI